MKYITAKKGVMSGDPCIIGTRIPIWLIFDYLKQGYSLKDMHRDFPWVSMKKLQGALNEALDNAFGVIVEKLKTDLHADTVSQV